MYFLLAILIGLSINYFSGGLEFNSLICIFAGLFLIMPFLLKFKFKELISIKKDIKLVGKNFFINLIFVPIIFIGIGYLFFGLDKILIGFALLSILSGGGLLLSWINKTRGSTKKGFQLFFINFIIFNILFLPFSNFIETNITNDTPQSINNVIDSSYMVTNPYISGIVDYKKAPEGENNCIISDITDDKLTCFSKNGGGISGVVAFMILIILPFIISRILLINKTISKKIIKYIKPISTIATFLLIGYIFSLKDLHGLLYQELSIAIKLGISILIGYLIVFISNYLILIKSKKKEEDISLFWLGTTRFITLGLIFSFVYSYLIGEEILLIFIFAYFIQIGLSIIFSNIINKKILNK